MKLLENNKPALLYSEIVPLIMPKGTYDWQKDKGILKVHGRGGNGNQVLIEYDSLLPKHKALVNAKYGDPYELVMSQPIKNLVRKDYKAEEFFEKYRFSNGSPLPKPTPTQPRDYKKEYTDACGWLNMIVAVLSDKKKLKSKPFYLTLDQFWKVCVDLIKSEGEALPYTVDNLRKRVKEYKLKGYESMISGRFENSNSMKVGKVDGAIDAEVAAKQIAMIRKAASLHQNFTPEEITINVNPIFQANGWEMLSRSTISNIIDANRHIVTPGKRGTRIYNSTIARQVIRERPHYPLQYVTLDGWTAELLYQDESGYNNRLVIVIVLDVMNNYPLGYAIGERENVELIRQACRNALLHTHELFHDYYRPWQIQSDHYGIKSQTPFYQAMGHLFTPAAVGNAKSKVIEPYFKDLNKKYCKYEHNWSGFNITARRENQPNAEFLNKIKKNFPDKKGVIWQLEQIIEKERAAKISEYKQQWSVIAADVKPPVLDAKQQIIVYGKQTGYLNSIIGKGLCVTIESQKLTYDSFDPAFRAMAHLKWRITYLPEHLDKIVATSEDNKFSFLLDQTRLIGMGIMNKKEGDNEYLQQIKEFNTDRKNEIVQTYIEDAELVDEILSNTPLQLNSDQETRIKLMFTNNGQQKEGLQDAKRLGVAKRLKQKQLKNDEVKENKNLLQQQVEYLDSKESFNKYLD
jgi:hypothetical protein